MAVFIAFLLAVGHGLLAGMFGVFCVSLYMTDCCRCTCMDKVRTPRSTAPPSTSAPTSSQTRSRRSRKKRKPRSQRHKVEKDTQQHNDVKENDVKENDGKENDGKENALKENAVKENDGKENAVKENDVQEKEKPQPPFSFRPHTSIFGWLVEMAIFSVAAFTVLFVGVALLSFIGQLLVPVASDLLPLADEDFEEQDGMCYSEKYGAYQVEGEQHRYHNTRPGAALTAVYGLGMVGWLVFSFLVFALVMWLGPYVMSWG